MSKKKKAEPWAEEVWYVDCPYCEEVVELGSGVIFENGDEASCTECDKTFTLTVEDE